MKKRIGKKPGLNGVYSKEEAEKAIKERYSADDQLVVHEIEVNDDDCEEDENEDDW